MASTKLRRLEQAARAARDATQRRNDLICELRDEGVPLRTIAEAAGLSHTAIARIVALPRE